MLAALTTSAFTLANWFRTRWIRVRQVAGAPRGWRAHWRRRWREKALQARLMHTGKAHETQTQTSNVIRYHMTYHHRHRDKSMRIFYREARISIQGEIVLVGRAKCPAFGHSRETAYLCATPGGRFGEHAVLIAAYARHGHRYRVIIGGICATKDTLIKET